MTKIIVNEITHCKDCPFKHATPYPTSDSWERAEYWWCGNPDNNIVIEETEERQQLKLKLVESGAPEKIRYIQGYVEWNDEKRITCQPWCKLQDK